MEQRLRKVFSETLAIAEQEIVDSLSYGSGSWDSVAHMSLVAALESEFECLLDTDDVIDLSSFAKAREILQKYEQPSIA